MSKLSGWTIKQLNAAVGGLSNPSKMPGYGYGIPAMECKTGGKLQKVKDSVCHGCYAMKGRYVFPKVKEAMYRRLGLMQNNPDWVEAMAELINRRYLDVAAVNAVFRWHDSGDIQDEDHLTKIVEVCKLTPNVKHWIPTREYAIVRAWVAKHGAFPPNLNVRLSAHMIGGKAPTFPDLKGLATVSTVSKNNEAGGYDCPARFQGNMCGACRACWDPEVSHVDYHLH